MDEGTLRTANDVHRKLGCAEQMLRDMKSCESLNICLKDVTGRFKKELETIVRQEIGLLKAEFAKL